MPFKIVPRWLRHWFRLWEILALGLTRTVGGRGEKKRKANECMALDRWSPWVFSAHCLNAGMHAGIISVLN